MSNIFKVDNERDIDSILEKNRDKIIMIIYSETSGKYVQKTLDVAIKRIIKHHLASENTDSLFLYIDLPLLKVTNNKYTNKINAGNIPFMELVLRQQSIFWLSNVQNANDVYQSMTKYKKQYDDIKSQEPSQHTPQPAQVPQISQQPNIQQENNTLQTETQQHVDPAITSQIPNVSSASIDEQLSAQKKIETIQRIQKELQINELEKIKKMKENNYD